MNNKGELMPGGTVARPGKSDKEHLVGSWILISLSAGDGAKETMPYGPNPKGTICIRQSHDRDAEENTPIVQGCIAYFGTYSMTKRPM